MTASLPPLDPSTHGMNYRVTGQVETQNLTTDGRFVDGYTVSFETQHGVQGSVFIARNRYRPDEVARQVAAQAAVLDEVAYLGNEGT